VEDAEDSSLAADVWEYIVVSTESEELLEVHQICVAICVSRVDVAQRIEELAHEVDHDL